MPYAEGGIIAGRRANRKAVIAALIGVIALALAVRVYLIATSEIVSRDGITFVKYAQALRSDPVAAMRQHAQHPLYPLTILIVHAVVGSWLPGDPVFVWPVAGQIASMLGGILVIWGAYALGRVIWDARVGVITALFAGVLPELCQVTSDALSDGLHLGLYLGGLAAVLRAQKTPRLRSLAAAAILSALAFLTRPEGGSVLVVGLVTLLMASADRGWTWRRRICGTVLMLVCFFAVAGPYMFSVGRFVQKKNVFELFGLERTPQSAAAPMPTGPDTRFRQPARADHSLRIPAQLVYYWGRACRVIYLVLALPALVTGVIPRPRRVRPIALAAGLHVCLLYALSSSFGYLSLRHVLILAALTLPFAGATFVWLVDQASIRVASRHSRRARVVRPVLYLVGVVSVIAPTVPWMLRPIGGGNGYLISAGRWLHAHSEPDEAVLTTRNRIAYYAERTMVPGPDTGQIKHLVSYIRQLNPHYLVIEEGHITSPDRNPDFFADLENSPLSRRLELIHEEPSRDAGDSKVLIYRAKAAPSPRALTSQGSK